MNAYNPIETMRHLEEAGFARKQAECLADEMRGAIVQLVTEEQLKAALDRQTIRLSAIVGGMLAIAVTISNLFA